MNPAEYFKASFMASFSRESVEFSVDSLKDMHGNVSWEESQELVWNPENFYQRILILFFCFALIFFFFKLFIVENFTQAKAKGFHNELTCSCHSASIMLNL